MGESLHFDHYKVRRDSSGNHCILAENGVGTTYFCTDRDSEKNVLLRAFPFEALTSKEQTQIFQQNAQRLIEIDHPRITPILDTGQHARGIYYVMAAPSTITLQEKVAHHGPFKVKQALDIIEQIANALIAVESYTEFLRHVTPGTILYSESGSDPRISLIPNDLTPGDSNRNDIEFAAPEEIEQGTVDARTRIYSIGTTFWYLLCGEAPFTSRNDSGVQIPWYQIPRISTSPRALLSRMLEFDADDRFQNLREVKAAITHCRAPELTSIVRIPSEDEISEAKNVTNPGASEQPKPQLIPVPMSPVVASDPVDTAETPGIRTSPRRPKDAPTNESKLQEELVEARQETQRLSLELTRRVRRELELSEQVRRAEDRLEKQGPSSKESPISQPISPPPALDDSDALKRIQEERALLAREREELETQKRKNDSCTMIAENRLHSITEDQKRLSAEWETLKKQQQAFQEQKENLLLGPKASQAEGIPSTLKDLSNPSGMTSVKTSPVSPPRPQSQSHYEPRKVAPASSQKSGPSSILLAAILAGIILGACGAVANHFYQDICESFSKKAPQATAEAISSSQKK